MKNKKVIIFLVIINIILMGIICSLISKNGNIIKDKQIIKEMTETEYDNSITTLNKSHEEYALQIQENKIKIASAITDMGIETSENANIDTIVSNIRSISTASSADKVSYDNTNTGLSATNVQGAVDEVNGSLNNLKNTIIKCGKTASMTVTSGASGTINVTFENAFDVIPNVVVSPVYDYNSSKNGYCDTVITSITTSGFNVRFSNNSDANRTLYISWIAIGQK